MKGRILAVALTAVVGLVVFFNGPQAQARIASEPAVESLFAELNSGELDAALTSFSEDAIARNMVRGETYTGPSEIRQMLARMHKEGRRLDIVGVQAAGDQTLVTVEVSDHGLVWGVEKIVVGMKGGKIQTFDVTAFRLELWRIAR